jgi:catalase
MTDDEHPELDFDPLDDTKTWPEDHEPSTLAGLAEAGESYREYRPYIEGHLQRAPIERENNYQQAGERYRTIEQWERDDLVKNLIDLLNQCEKVTQEKMVWHFSQCDDEFGSRVAEGIGLDYEAARA